MKKDNRNDKICLLQASIYGASTMPSAGIYENMPSAGIIIKTANLKVAAVAAADAHTSLFTTTQLQFKHFSDRFFRRYHCRSLHFFAMPRDILDMEVSKQ